MTIFENPDFDAHESVHVFHDPKSRLRAVIAIHSTTLGPAAGGCRRWCYDDSASALTDALRLSRGMSYKNALARLPFGGGKAVILADPHKPATAAEFHAFGRFVNSLDGRYVTAEDVGVTTDHMLSVREVTRYVSGLPQHSDSAGGDPSPWTALGVYLAMHTAVRWLSGSPRLPGCTVAVQGVGQVGYHLCRLLHRDGVQLLVADIDTCNADRAARDFGARVVRPDEILSTPADILAPCALGGILNQVSIAGLKAHIVAGAANNQLATPDDAAHLHERGILFLPDYLINAGGIIAVVQEYLGGSTEKDVKREVAKIPDRLSEVVRLAHEHGIPPAEMADLMARKLIGHSAQAATPKVYEQDTSTRTR